MNNCLFVLQGQLFYQNEDRTYMGIGHQDGRLVMALVITAVTSEDKEVIISTPEATHLAIETAKRDLGVEFEEVEKLSIHGTPPIRVIEQGQGAEGGAESDPGEGCSGEKTPSLIFSSPEPEPVKKKKRRRSKAAASACMRGRKIAAMAKSKKK